MRVLTFGWDYPPVKNGGLGVACKGLTEQLVSLGVEVVFVLPKAQDICFPGKHIFADNERITVRPVYSPLIPYGKSNTLLKTITNVDGKDTVHARVLIDEVYRYARKAAVIAAEKEHDVIHAHDWVSYLAGMNAKRVSGKPLVLHVHATSFDQAGGGNVDPEIYKIEQEAFEEADSIVAISNFTKDIIAEKYNVDASKIIVIHNGCDLEAYSELSPALQELKANGKKIVLFHGRLTIQKGPDYFVRAARRVIDVDPSVVFVISGWGDMERQIMHLVGELGLSGNVIFAGALWDEERDRMYQSADLLVMPSVSEPFGLVPLEAIQNGTPVLISKQSGVSEVLKHALRVDFWDVEEMANKILAAVKYEPLNRQLREYSRNELMQLSWRKAAHKVKEVYGRLRSWFNEQVAV